MDEENQEQEGQELSNLAKQGVNKGKGLLEKPIKQGAENLKRKGTQAAVEGIKKIAAQIAAQIAAFIATHLVLIIIIIVIIVLTTFTIFVLIPAADNYLDELNAQKTDEVTYQVLQDYCTIGEDGIHFDKEKFLKNIVAELSLNGIDLNDLGFGDDGNYRMAAQNTVSGTEIIMDTLNPNTQAAQYLYKFITASLTGELPYIEGSDKEVQGIVKIKRRMEGKDKEEEAKELTYIGYEAFQEKLKTTKDFEKDDLLNYFSLDSSWNLCIAKPYKHTTNLYNHGTLTSSIKTYEISEVKIPYRDIIAQYTTPFLFLIDLQFITNNAAYVEAVSELMSEQSEIEFTILDQITSYTSKYNYKATRHTRSETEIEGYEEPQISTTTSSIDETTEIIIHTDIIKANVTKAKTWIIEQETNYELEETPDYEPYGENGKTTSLDSESEPDGLGSWDTDRSEYNYLENITREWLKSTGTQTVVNPSEFMGLWSNETGRYVKGAPYRPNGVGLPGKIVEYQVLNSMQLEDAIGKIITSKDELYELLEDGQKTQTHAEIMRECINFYLTGKELTRNFAMRFVPLFDTDEFLEINWNNLGTGFWWPINDVTQTRISSVFGYRGDIGVAGASKFHKGIDIAVPQGTEIIAVADGTVEVAGFSKSAGNWIRINHANGIKTVYMHNSKLLVSVGQEVKQGDIIALSGNTGISGGPHLHFGVQVNGEYVNPQEYVNPNKPRPSALVPDVPVNVQAWRPYIVQAFSELGYVMTEEKIEAILRQITTESRGNQAIMQGIKDSNSGKPITINAGVCPWCSPGTGCKNTNIGHGLLQFIPTTFYANMIPGHTNIFNGYDQICACITMLEKRSGSYTDYIGKGTGWG